MGKRAAPPKARTPAKKRAGDARATELLRRKARDTAREVKERRAPKADIAADRSRFLAEADHLLGESLEYETALRSVANLVVPRLATWCTVHILEEGGGLRELAMAHADPAMIEFARDLQKKYPSDNKALLEILRSGKTQLYPVITDEMLVKSAKDAEHLRITRSLKLSSYMGVPLVARGKAVGLIGFFASDGRHYTHEDVEFAEVFASRAALAVDNARLFRESKRASEELRALNAHLEEKVKERTEELAAAQRKDRANFQRMRFMIRSLPLAAMAIDEDGIIQEVNQHFCDMLGFHKDPSTMIGHPRAMYVEQWKGNIVDFEQRAKEFDEALRTKQPLIGQEKRMKDGRILLRDLIPIQEDGVYLGSLILYRDVTQERRIDATKSEFMSLASHQLRTPLTAIRWIFGRLAKNLQGKLGELEEHLLEDGRRAAARMSETINTMLQISRIQSGQLEPSLRPVRLSEFLPEAIEPYAGITAAKEHAVSVVCPADLELQSDPQLLREVICNLFGNAVKYTPRKGRISLSASRAGNTIHINVQDTGYGIPKHQQAKVFHKFFRGDNVVSQDPDGTGLGLHMVSLITELLGGTIAFESEEGRGTTFRIGLPAA